MNFKMMLFCIAAFIFSAYSKGACRNDLQPSAAGNFAGSPFIYAKTGKTPVEHKVSNPKQGGFLSWYTKTYKDTVNKDTSFFINGTDKVEIKVRYYCTYDKKIVLTGQYLEIYDAKGHLVKAPDKFVTHNFVSDVKVKLNSKPIFNGIVKKENFANQGLEDDLKQFGVLAFQAISKYSRGFTIYFRIGIPTNEYRGEVATLDFDSAGRSSFKLH